MKIKFKYVGVLIIAALVITITSSSLVVAVGGMTIGGCIYTGDGTVTYTPVGPEIEATYSTTYAGAVPITDAQVMVQNQHSGGAFVTYGNLGPSGSNPYAHCWGATIPDTDGNGTPDVTDLIVMFSAPGHGITSREFTWDATLGEFVHPTGPDVGAGALVQGTSNLAIGPQDAYLPPLTVDTDGDSVPDALPTGHLLHYVFYDNFVNGGDNGPIIDPPLNGVTVRVVDEDGNIVATQKTGELAFSQGGFTTVDGLTFVGDMAYGYVYFSDLPAGELLVYSDPTTVTQADNPHFTLKMDHTGDTCSTDVYGYNNTDCNWYQTYTEEAGHAWEAYVWPGWPGTEAGGYATWHGFIEKLGNDVGGGNPLLSGSISGIVVDADGNDPEEPFPQTLGGRRPPTNARFEDGTPWDINTNAGVVGNPTNTLTFDTLPNARIPDVIVALYTAGGDTPQLVGTAEASGITHYNDPTGTEFTFTNVPPGQYEIFTFDKDLVNVPMIGNGVSVTPQANSAITVLMPRFAGRVMGFVENNGVFVAGAEVKTFFKAGTTKDTAVTNANGWFLNDMLPETGSMGHVYVNIPDGAAYRGKIVTEEFQKFDNTLPFCVPAVGDTTCPGLNPGDPPLQPNPKYTMVTHNAMSRAVQWWTLNYFADIQVEDIPVGVGNLMGVVFNDHLNTVTRTGNGVWDEAEDRLWQGESVQLYPASGGVCDTAAAPLTAMTGKHNKGDSDIQGWAVPYAWPLDEIGGVYGAPAVCPTCSQTTGTPAPAVGFYEFRDVAPGDYCVRVIPSAGFQVSDADVGLDGFEHVTVTGGLNSRVDLGVNTTPVGSTWGVPLAGEMEGGMFSGNGDLDPNPTSLLFDEASAIVGSPVAVYDHYNYFIGVMYQGDPYCHAFNNSIHTPGDPNDPFSCVSTIALEQKPEAERRFAPGVHRYNGNDSAFLWTTWDPTIPAYNPNFDQMELGYAVPQGGYKFEAAWTPLTPPGGNGATADMCAISLVATSFTSEPWGANVAIKVSDGYIMLAGAQVMGNVNGQGMNCTTNGAGACTINFEKFEGAGSSATFNVDTITVKNQPWYVYNPNPGGILAGACRASLDIYEPGTPPPPPPPAPQCSDGADNDGDGLTDFPADPGCVDAQDNNEQDAPPPPPAPQCSDGLDNDGDTLIDWPNDPGCVDAADNDETDPPLPPPPQCSDWIDNDGDGLIDMADPGCSSIMDNDETDPAGGGATSVHVEGLTGWATYKEGKLIGNFEVTIFDDSGALVNGATVTFTYTWLKEGKPKTKPASCVTDATGMCTGKTKPMEGTSSVEVTVVGVSDPALPYAPQDNTAATTITVP